MATPSGPNTPGVRGRAFSSSQSTSSLQRPASELSIRNGAPLATADARSSAMLPKGFEGMLKTTTETGDIGMFSIKPSRVRPSVNSPRRVTSYNEQGLQRPRQNFQHHGVPIMDDRRRLPSYARDPTSELISMYESPSQKSSRVFEDSDYRSFSMTQASSYTLSNHRSYTSLRSQPDGSGPLQRPRSPFAYPTRLRRPGFRPSSPALTDGGGVDYRRRAEIDRMTYGGHTTSSPSSLYAQKRMPPPLSLRPEGNRSTPSLLSQTSPSRRSSSPLVQQTNGNSNADWPRRNGPASVNTSPARSTLSLTSTVNNCQGNLPPSNTTTPGKLSTPIYYDYTEEFAVDDNPEPATREPPPQFRIDSTIPEDRPMSSEPSIPVESNGRTSRQGLENGIQCPPSAVSMQHMSNGVSSDANSGFANGPIQWPVRKTSLPRRNPTPEPKDDKFECQIDRKAFRLSRLGYGARELNDHVEEAFGLAPSVSFAAMNAERGGQAEYADQIDGTGSNKPEDTHIGHHIQQTSRPRSTGPPGPTSSFENPTISHLEDIANRRKEEQAEDKAKGRLGSLPLEGIGNPRKTDRRASSLDFTSACSKRSRFSGFNSLDEGFTNIADLISTLENANRAQNPPEAKANDLLDRPQETESKVPPSLQGPQKGAKPVRIIAPTSTFNHRDSLHQPRSDAFRANTQRHQRKQDLHHHGERGQDMLQDYCMGDVPNFSHQIPRKSVSRSGSPMLAPKPISPARQLKLKNSVPQLMKALPPIPPDPPIRVVSPPDYIASKRALGLPFKFSPLTEAKIPPIRDLPPIPEPGFSPGTDSAPPHVNPSETLSSISKSLPPVPLKKDLLGESLPIPPSTPRLKLKVRSTAALGTRSLKSEESGPHSSQAQNNDTPPVIRDGKSKASSPPKFKLKVTRASNSSEGTVKINRESSESKPFGGLKNPKDLFTPSAGIDNVFRQVSRHLHTRKSSANSDDDGIIESAAPLSSPGSPNDGGGQNSTSSLLSTANPNASDVRSFFSDASSHMQGRHSLRKRLSNFRARIGVPYSSRAVSQSLEDIPLRAQTRPDASRPAAAYSVPNLHANESSSEDLPSQYPGERGTRRKLRDKFTKWLKEARSAIAARVKIRSSTAEKK